MIRCGKTKGRSTNATLPTDGKARGKRLYAQSGDQGRGASATSKQAGTGEGLGDVLVREKGRWADLCVKYERTRGLSLAVGHQIDRAKGMRTGLAGLQRGAVGPR